MAHEIKIYGDVINQSSKDAGAKGVTLLDLQNQLAKANGEAVKVRLNCLGGDVDEGFAMYDELRRYAQETGTQIHTYAEANLASIATIVFLAGDTREISRHIEPFVHNAWTEAIGDSRVMAERAATLEKCNDQIAKHYADHTELSYEEARELMNAETSITAKEALKMRFATKIENVFRPVALQRFNNSQKQQIMSNPKKKGIMAKIMDILSSVQNKKLNTATQGELDFYELEEDDVIEVGAKANLDGQPADGSIVMENGETYVFDNGTLTEIIEAEEDEPQDLTEIENLQAEIAALKETNETLNTQLEEVKVQNKTMRTALNNVRRLQSEIVDDDPAPRQRQPRSAEPVKGQAAKAAVASYAKKLNPSKK